MSVVTSPPQPPLDQPTDRPADAEQPDLRAVVDDLVRDLIRRDPALWAAVQADPALLRQFSFAVDDGSR